MVSIYSLTLNGLVADYIWVNVNYIIFENLLILRRGLETFTTEAM